jgi:integrase
MNSSLANILENYSIEDLNRLKQLIDEVETKRKETNSRPLSLKKFRSEYEHYIENNFSESYLKSIKLSFNHLINFCGPDKKLTHLTVKDADEFKCHIMQNAPLGFKIYIRNLKAAFNKAVDWEMISSNPFAKIKIAKHQQVTPKFMKLKELNAILENTKSPVIAELFRFAFYTGCRPGEIVKLRWENINLKKRMITIGDKNLTTKNKRTRVVPICNELLNRLKSNDSIRKSTDFVFSKSNGFPYNRDYISRCCKKSIRAAGLDEDLHLYSLRHSFASNLAGKGAPIIAVKDLLGHSSITTTQIYSHSDLESLQNAIRKLDEFY